MSDAVLIAMLAYINDLQRSIDVNEAFVADVLALASEAEANPIDGPTRQAMLDLARRHRVDAIKARAKMEAMSEQFIARYGVERFKQRRSHRPI